jgi:hypothetical protein
VEGEGWCKKGPPVFAETSKSRGRENRVEAVCEGKMGKNVPKLKGQSRVSKNTSPKYDIILNKTYIPRRTIT